MAIINKTGITNGGTIQAEHITRAIDALSGVGTDSIIASGSFTGSFTGSAGITNLQIGTNGYFISEASGIVLLNATNNSLDTQIQHRNGIISSSFSNLGLLINAPVTATSFTGSISSTLIRVTGSINLSGSLNVNNSAGVTIINSSAYGLYRASGQTSIDWSSGTIYDSNNNAAIQVDNNYIYDINNQLSIDWQNRQLRDSTEVISQDYTSRILYDTTGAPIINYSQAEYVQLDAVLSLEIRTTTPAAGSVPTGSIMVSGSGTNARPYFFTGATWREISLL